MLEYCDGFETYTDPAKRWDSGSTGSVGPTYARTGAAAIELNLGQFCMRRFQASAANAAVIVQGAAVRVHNEHGGVPTIFSLLDEGTVQVYLRWNGSTDSSLSAVRGNGTVLGSSAGAVVPFDEVYRYIEWKVTLHNSAGAIQVWVNGVSVINLSGIDTTNTANAYATHHRIGQIAGNQRCRFDDYYVLNGDSGSNTPLGDCRVVPLAVTGAGNSTQFTPSAGSNFQNVDDTNPNDDTDYNASSTAGHKDLFALADSAVTAGTVHGLQVITRARKDDAGARTMRNLIRTNGTDFESGDFAMADSYQSFGEVWDVNPDTAAAWTISDINALEAGYKVQA